MSEKITIEQLMNRMPKAFLPDKAGDVEAKLQFHFTGDQAGDWLVTIQDQKCSVEQTATDEPTLAVTVDAADWLDIFTGGGNAMAAFAAGKIKLKGDLNFALKMMNYFET
jgi:putative sterol carrier protein